MKIVIATVAALLAAGQLRAEESKIVEKRVGTLPAQRIEIRGISGSNISIRSWAKDSVYIRLNVSISSSDDEYEKQYIAAVGIDENRTESALLLAFTESAARGHGGGSIWDIFKRFYVNKEISGEIYVPQSNPFTSDMRYGTVSLDNMAGELRLTGTTNSLTLRNCSAVRQVDNNYGKTLIENSGGALVLSGTSSTVTITDFNGSASVDADYSTVTIERATKGVSVQDKSGKVKLSDIAGDVSVDANYSTMTISDVRGYLDVSSSSGSLRARNVDGIQVNAKYTSVDVSGVSGKSGKPIVINGSSGNVHLYDARGDVQIDDPYSTIELRRIDGNVRISTKSGRIDAEGINGNWDSPTEYTTVTVSDLRAKTVSATNSSNQIDITLLTVPSTVNIRNQYGGVRMRLPAGFSGSVDMNAEYGSIITNLPVNVKSLGSSAYATGKVGNGSGSISIETKSANIQLRAE